MFFASAATTGITRPLQELSGHVARAWSLGYTGCCSMLARPDAEPPPEACVTLSTHPAMLPRLAPRLDITRTIIVPKSWLNSGCIDRMCSFLCGSHDHAPVGQEIRPTQRCINPVTKVKHREVHHWNHWSPAVRFFRDLLFLKTGTVYGDELFFYVA